MSFGKSVSGKVFRENHLKPILNILTIHWTLWKQAMQKLKCEWWRLTHDIRIGLRIGANLNQKLYDYSFLGFTILSYSSLNIFFQVIERLSTGYRLPPPMVSNRKHLCGKRKRERAQLNKKHLKYLALVTAT